jgi:hypothetical protein
VVRTNGTGGKFVDASFVSGNIFSAVITNLTPDDQYSVSASVFNSDGQSPYSSAVIFTTWLNYLAQPKPGNPTVTNVTTSSARPWSSSIQVYGRPPVLEIEMRVRETGATAYASKTYTQPSSPPTFSSLSYATQYVAYYRVRNEVGWSDFSDFAFFTTDPVAPSAPDAVSIRNITQTTFEAYISANSTGGSPITDYELSWGLDPNFSSASKLASGWTIVSGLLGGRTYYVWGRVKNSVGWSPYSPRVSVKTIAGAFVKYNNTWKEAVPWVKHNGVWKVAKPWVRIMGVWKGVK